MDWEVQLAVESSKNQFACDAWNDWILDEKHENMNEFIHLAPIPSPRNEIMWVSQDLLLTNHFPKFDLHVDHHHTGLKGEVLQEATTFCHYGHYRSLLHFFIMAIELDNAPFTLKYCMYKVLGKQLGEFVFASFVITMIHY